MRINKCKQLILKFLNTIILSVFLFFSIESNIIQAQVYTYPFDLPIKPTTQFYLTATPLNHSTDGNRAAIDFQIIDDAGFIDKGAPLYSPLDGYAIYTESPNNSGVIEIEYYDNKWKLVIAHIENEAKASKEIINTYPKHVKKGELIGYQGDSGYINNSKFPVHVHFEVFKKFEGEFTNDDSVIDICSQINLNQECDYIDYSGYVIFIKDK